MNLQTELEQSKKSKITQEEANMADIKLLLEGKTQEDLEMMRSLAPNSVVIANETYKGILLDLEKLDKEYGGKIYTLDMIKKLAIDYHLRFLNTKYFKGNLPVETLQKIREFSKYTNASIDKSTLGTHFFILAPAYTFGLTVGVKPPDIRRQIDWDPILFYKVDRSHYRMIHKWGKDFSAFRRILGWKWKNINNLRHFSFFTQLPFLAVIVALLFSPTYLMLHWIQVSIPLVILSYLIATIRNVQVTYYNGSKRKAVTDYFSPSNWDDSARYITKLL